MVNAGELVRHLFTSTDPDIYFLPILSLSFNILSGVEVQYRDCTVLVHEFEC